MTDSNDLAVPVFQHDMNPVLALLRGAGRPLTIKDLGYAILPGWTRRGSHVRRRHP